MKKANLFLGVKEMSLIYSRGNLILELLLNKVILPLIEEIISFN
jgi:hypothetical protein